MSLVITQNIVLSGKDCQTEKPYWSKVCWNNKTAGIIASSETVGFEAGNALSQNTYQHWIPNSMPATAEITLSAAVSFIGIAASDLSAKGVAVKAEYFDGSAYQLISEAIPANDYSMIFIFDEVSTEKVRLTFTGAEAPQIGIIQAGDVITMQSNLESGFVDMQLNREVTFDNNISENGQLLGRKIVRTSLTGSPSWEFLRFNWVAETFLPFMYYADTNAFFFIPSPQYIPESSYYCWVPKEPIRPESRNNKFLPIKMNLEAYLG